jgi:UDP-N-acetylglucosamine--N-acetylmuramyl-(pentapeptide) pyrophosphoryl-undecaprenol N-acetylglucosamine transferase
MAWVRFTALRGKGCCASCCCPSTCCAASPGLAQLGRIRPDVVLGMGGYVSFPGGMMAALRGIPLVLHEQNSVAGLANRVLAGVADRVMTGFPGVLKKGVGRQPGACRNRRAASADSRYAAHDGPLRLLVVGGSLGAQALNEALPKALALIAERAPASWCTSPAKSTCRC